MVGFMAMLFAFLLGCSLANRQPHIVFVSALGFVIALIVHLREK